MTFVLDTFRNITKEWELYIQYYLLCDNKVIKVKRTITCATFKRTLNRMDYRMEQHKNFIVLLVTSNISYTNITLLCYLSKLGIPITTVDRINILWVILFSFSILIKTT